MAEQSKGQTYNVKANPSNRYLLVMLGAMLLLSAATSLFLSPLLDLIIKDQVYHSLILMLLHTWIIFYLPAWLVEYYYRRSRYDYCYRVGWTSGGRKWLWWVSLFYLLSIPMVEALAGVMELLPVPEALESLKQNEAATRETLKLLMADQRPLTLLLTILAFAVVTPFAEEVFFRGALQGWLLTRVQNRHAVIWLVGLIFSLMHLEWSGFLARWFLGALLGYLALYGGLWLAIAFHMLNNLVALLMLHTTGEQSLLEKSEPASYWIIAVLAVVAGVVTFRLLQRMAREQRNNNEQTDNEIIQ